MEPRPIDSSRDLPAVADLLSRTRASGGISHPGGVQWWLRTLWDDRDDFEAYVWDDGAAISGFALVDATFVVTERLDRGPSLEEQLGELEGRLRAAGRASLHTDVVEGKPERQVLERLGYSATDTWIELIADVDDEPSPSGLPGGYRFVSLQEVSDARYIEGHRAAWSDARPSRYRPILHEAVTRMPQFRRDLVTIALAADGTVASYCIGWLDERSRTLEIEPLGTHRDHRRLGLAHAVVKEAQRRAWANGAEHVLVWNSPATLPIQYGLYTGAGMTPRRTLVELAKAL